MLIYAGAIQGVLVYEGSKVVEYRPHMYLELNDENTGGWLVVPGMSKLVALSNTLRKESTLRYDPAPWMEHRTFGWFQLGKFKPYENMARRTLPDDAVGRARGLGVKGYYLPDLKIIDLGGLADKTVARNPQTMDGRRRLAHERQPPPGYLEQRGVNFHVHPAARTVAEALRRAQYALEVDPNVWMPFDSDAHQWVAEGFAGLNVWRRSP